MTEFNGRNYDFNNQSDRADFRKAGGYVDDTGAYAPGAGGQRLGDTWSGANAGRNAPDNGNRLPVVGGRPVSPSNGFTGANTGYIMYRGDPMYQAFFGAGTPGFSSAPTPWAPGQQASWNGMDPMNYLGNNPDSQAYLNALASGSAQTPFASYVKSNGLSLLGMPSYNMSGGGLQDPIQKTATPGGGRQNA